MKLLLLFATGAFTGLSFPWPGSPSSLFMLGIIQTLAKKVHAKLRSSSNPVNESIAPEHQLEGGAPIKTGGWVKLKQVDVPLSELTEATASGDCFEAAVTYMMDHGALSPFSTGENDGLLLVHGEVTGQGAIEGVQYAHAWIEDGNTVIDTSNGRHIKMPKDAYYRLGRITANVHKYTAKEVRRHLVTTKVYGPWELKTSTGL